MTKIYVSFDNNSTAEANKLASDLYDHLSAKVDTDVEITRDRNDTMDFGATVAILLGTNSAVAIAKGISSFIKKRSEVSIIVRTERGEVIASNLTSKDVPFVLETSLTHLSQNAN